MGEQIAPRSVRCATTGVPVPISSPDLSCALGAGDFLLGGALRECSHFARDDGGNLARFVFARSRIDADNPAVA